MGINMNTISEQFAVDDQSWLGAKMGTDVCRSVTIDVGLFTTDHYPNGFIPSGTVLGKVTATGLYGPYDDTAVDGRAVATGLLFHGAQAIKAGTTLGKLGVAMFWTGIVKQSKLPNFTGTANAKGEIDANGRADLPTIRWEA